MGGSLARKSLLCNHSRKTVMLLSEVCTAPCNPQPALCAQLEAILVLSSHSAAVVTSVATVLAREVKLSCGRHAGSYGRQLLEDGGEGLKLQPWQIAVGVAFTVGALAYIGRIAKDVRACPILSVL